MIVGFVMPEARSPLFDIVFGFAISTNLTLMELINILYYIVYGL